MIRADVLLVDPNPNPSLVQGLRRLPGLRPVRVDSLAGMQRVLADLRKVLRLARHRQLTVPGRLQASLEEHRRIIAAFRQRDADLADRCMQRHLNAQWEALVQLKATESETRPTQIQAN